MDYTLIRRYSDDREDERSDWDSHGHPVRVGDLWPVEADGLKWQVTKVTASDGTNRATIVLELVSE